METGKKHYTVDKIKTVRDFTIRGSSFASDSGRIYCEKNAPATQKWVHESQRLLFLLNLPRFAASLVGSLVLGLVLSGAL